MIACYELFSDGWCAALVDAWDDENQETGVIFSGDELIEDDRRSSHICWLEFDDHPDVVRRLFNAITTANTEHFHFDLVGFRDRLQLSRYRIGDYYNWHCDAGGKEKDRQLSFSVQLNDDYAGGDLEIGGHVMPRRKGCLTVFPSDLKHRVTEVTDGERFSLVGWIV